MFCKTRRRHEAAEGGYEGETTRLSLAGAAVEQRTCGGWGGFPWWTLWLIWPLMMLMKWSVPLIGAVYAELMAVSVPIVPVVLILLGLALIVRRRMV